MTSPITDQSPFILTSEDLAEGPLRSFQWADKSPLVWTDDGHEEGHLTSLQWTMLDGRPWTVQMLWSSASGRLEPISVTVTGRVLEPVDGPPVLADVLRRLPVGAMQRQARRHAIAISSSRSPSSTRSPSAAEFYAELGKAHRGVASSPEEIRKVADIYLEAWTNFLPVTDAVATEFGISKSTAAKRIMKARRAGLLGAVPRTGPR